MGASFSVYIVALVRWDRVRERLRRGRIRFSPSSRRCWSTAVRTYGPLPRSRAPRKIDSARHLAARRTPTRSPLASAPISATSVA